MRTRVADLTTVDAVERELDQALTTLRQLDAAGPSNTMARSSVEYRIGSLRKRKMALELQGTA